MNAERKAEWVAALRSGEFPQGEKALARKEDDTINYCCLGVACELAVRAGVIAPGAFTDTMEQMRYFWRDEEGNERAEGSTLPTPVRVWLELDDTNPVVNFDEWPEGVNGSVYNGTPSLAEVNDCGVPFSTIADIIEAQF